MSVELLRKSFNLVAPEAQALVDTFYSTLFERYPAVKPLFAEVELKNQKGKLIASLAFVVENLEKPGELSRYLGQLGARHVDYGAAPEHYPCVGECLLVALAKTAGDAWNEELEQAWTEAYQAVAALMLAGVESEAA